MGKPQVIVITGASSGIGRAAAERFARRGASLVLAARGRDALEDVAARCRSRGARTVVVPTDVADANAVASLADTAAAAFGRIDAWVCAAGVLAYGEFEALPADRFRRVMDVNFLGQVHSARAVLPYFRRQREGTLILVGSLYSVVSSPYLSAYVASKHALRGFARSLRQELRRARGIRVTTVLPATIDTAIYHRAANRTGRRPHPLPPVASPARVARAIVRSAARPRAEVFVGRAQRLATTPLHALLPGAYDRSAGPVMRRLGLRGRAPDSDGNLFSPAADAPIDGGWRSPARRLLLVGGIAVAVTAWLRRR